MGKHTEYELPYKFEPWDGRVVDNNDMYVEADHVLTLLNTHARLVEALRNVKFGLEEKLVGSDAFTLESMIEGVSKTLAQLDGEVR